MSNKTLTRLILFIWLLAHVFLAYELFPFAQTLMSFNTVNSITMISHFVDINTMTRILANVLDKKDWLDVILLSIKPIEFFVFIFDCALIFALIEDEFVIKYAKLQLSLAILYQALIFAFFMFSLNKSNTHFVLTILHIMAGIIYLWIFSRVVIPLITLIKSK